MACVATFGGSTGCLGLLERGLAVALAAAKLACDCDTRIHGVQAADKPVVPEAGRAVVPLHLGAGGCGLRRLVLLHAAAAVGDVVLVRVLPRKEVGVVWSVHRKAFPQIVADLFTLSGRHFGKEGRKAACLGFSLACRLPTISHTQKTLFNFSETVLL